MTGWVFQEVIAIADQTLKALCTSTGPGPWHLGHWPAWMRRARSATTASGISCAMVSGRPRARQLALQKRNPPSRAPPNRMVEPQVAQVAMVSSAVSHAVRLARRAESEPQPLPLETEGHLSHGDHARAPAPVQLSQRRLTHPFQHVAERQLGGGAHRDWAPRR